MFVLPFCLHSILSDLSNSKTFKFRRKVLEHVDYLSTIISGYAQIIILQYSVSKMISNSIINNFQMLSLASTIFLLSILSALLIALEASILLSSRCVFFSYY